MSRRDSFLFTTSSCARPLRRLLGLMTPPSEDLRSQITSGKEYSVQASCTSRIVTNSVHGKVQNVVPPPLLTCAFHLACLQFQAFLKRAGGFIF